MALEPRLSPPSGRSADALLGGGVGAGLVRSADGLLVRSVGPLLGLLLALAGTASAQGYGDFEYAGLAEDARHEPSPLVVDGHTFKPTLTYKLLGVTTPHVFGSGGVGWTDNLLREDGDTPGVHPRRESWGRGVAGARLDTQLSPDHRIELEYRAAATDYLQTSRFESLEQQSTLRLDLDFKRFALHGDGIWRRSSFQQSIQLRGTIRVETSAATVWGEVGLGRVGLRLGGNFIGTNYLEPSLRFIDQKQAGANLQLFFRVQPRLRALAEYNWTIVMFDAGRHGQLNDYQVHEARAGLDGALTPRLSASLKGGVAFQEVDETAAPQDRRSFTGFVALASVRWQPLPRTSLSAAFARQVGVSINSNYLITDSIDLSARQQLLEERVTLDGNGGWEHSHVGPGGTLVRLRAGCGATWNLRPWLSVGARYDWELLHSSFQGDDYEVHTVSASVGVGF